MIVVCPCSPGGLHDETAACLLGVASASPVFISLDDDPLAYGRLLMSLWRDRAGFMIIEQDIAFEPQQLLTVLDCARPYCAGVYEWTTNIGPALGFTKFGPELVQSVPVPGLARVPWQQLDTYLMRDVLGCRYGWQPHLHLPPVRHLNPWKSPLRPEFQHLTVEEHLGALGWRVDADGATAEYVGGIIFGERREPVLVA